MTHKPIPRSCAPDDLTPGDVFYLDSLAGQEMPQAGPYVVESIWEETAKRIWVFLVRDGDGGSAVHKYALTPQHGLLVTGRDEDILERRRAAGHGPTIESVPAATLKQGDWIVESEILRRVERVVRGEQRVAVRLPNGETLTTEADAMVDAVRAPKTVPLEDEATPMPE